MFKWSFKHTITRISVAFNRSNIEHFSTISLDRKGKKNAYESFKSSIEIEQLTGDN
jgi:hypothetical protein